VQRFCGRMVLLFEDRMILSMETNDRKQEYLITLAEEISNGIMRAEQVIWSLLSVKAELFSGHMETFVPIPDSFKRAFDQVIRDNKIAKRRLEVFLRQVEYADASDMNETEFDLIKLQSLEVGHLLRLGAENAAELQPMVGQIRRSYEAACSGPLGLGSDWVDTPLEDDSEDDPWQQPT